MTTSGSIPERGARRDLIMKTILHCGIAALLLLTGCARNYVITLNSGRQITTAGKPRLEGVVYTYRDMSGREGRVSAGSVSQIGPASRSGNQTTGFEFIPAK